MRESIHFAINKHWLLPILFIITAFGFGYQAIPFLTWLYIPASLLYARNKSTQTIVLAYLVSSLGLSLGYLGNFSISKEGPRFPLFWIIILCAFIMNLPILITLFADKYLLKKYHDEQKGALAMRIFFFPCLWTSLWLFLARYGPLGDYISLSTNVVVWPEFGQIASLGGRSLMDFWMALLGTILFEYTVSEKEQISGRPLTIYSILMALMLIYGGARINIHTNSFYQVNYPEYVPKTVQVGCIVGPGGSPDFPQLQAQSPDIWLNMTKELAESGAKLVLWSELTMNVKDAEEEEFLVQQAKNLAQFHQIYLGITYGTVNENKLVFITKQGEIGFDYNKAHPVPGIETQPPGPNLLQYIDTEEFGRIGGGICFDFNFPSFISQASTHKVDIMLQPSWTWGPIGTYHQQSNIVRAVENGFTLFRCVSQGVSGIYEPTLSGIFNQKVASINAEKYSFYLPLQKRVDTLYGYVGDSFGFACMLITASLIVFTYYTSKRSTLLQGELAI